MSDAPSYCGKKIRTTKYGLPYLLICGLLPRHSDTCHDLENGERFTPDAPTEETDG